MPPGGRATCEAHPRGEEPEAPRVQQEQPARQRTLRTPGAYPHSLWPPSGGRVIAVVLPVALRGEVRSRRRTLHVSCTSTEKAALTSAYPLVRAAFAWWAVLGSNQRPLPCQGSALPLRQPPEVETGFEPVYTDLQSVASPLGHSTVMSPSGRRDSNPRPSPWQGDALPTEPRPHAPSRVPGRHYRSTVRGTNSDPARHEGRNGSLIAGIG